MQLTPSLQTFVSFLVLLLITHLFGGTINATVLTVFIAHFGTIFIWLSPISSSRSMSSFIIGQVESDSQALVRAKTKTSQAFLHVSTGMISIILQMSHFSIFSADRSRLNGFEGKENDKDDHSLLNI